MRVWYASDLHVESKANRDAVDALRSLAESERPDVLILGGDLCNGPHGLQAVLTHFSHVATERIYIPGNHELWDQTLDARTIYYQRLPEISARCGFRMLIDEPLVMDSIGFVASMGWYDGTFAGSMPYTADQIAAKRLGHRVLLDASQLRWIDGRGQPLSDEHVTDLQLDDLRTQLANVPTDVGRVIVGLHMVPHVGALGDRWLQGDRTYFRAFQGSSRLGDLLRLDPRISHVLCGHDHESTTSTLGGITVLKCPLGNVRLGADFDPKRHRVLLDV